MPLAAGTRLGPYEVLALLGAGGMGEVYRARDTRLDRTVAIKVLPEHLARNPDLRARLEREARAVAALNHPHICALHDIGSQDGVDFLVMEYLEGETLALRLARGPVLPDQALTLAVQIADALGAAHHKGITHRDLKPGNIMLTKSGAKLLDFGLARLSPSPVAHQQDLPTLSGDVLTQRGTLLGTLPYMSPEQLEGKDADSRSDLFAFGAVLYEMITGRRAFPGNSAASVIAAIMDSTPAPLDAAGLPASLDRLVHTCLAKDPDLRWQSARDLARELTWLQQPGPGQPAVPAPTRRTWLPWTLAAACLILFALLGLLWLRRPPPSTQLLKLSILPPENVPPRTVALSPDGRQIAFTTGIEGSGRLWLRSFDSLEARPVPQGDGASYPFWSPDSRSLAFFAQGKLKRADLGGAVSTLADAPGGRGGSWNRDGVILFVPRIGEGVFRIPAAGGVPTPVVRLDLARGENSYRWPHFLPDGRRFVFFIRSSQAENQGLYAASLDSPEKKRLTPDASSVEFAPAPSGPGSLLFVRGNDLLAQPFDPDRLDMKGDAALVASPVAHDGNTHANFSVSPNGVLAWSSHGGREQRQFVWMDRSGRSLARVGPEGGWSDIRLSPDGARAITSAVDPQTRAGDVWSLDTARGLPTRITFHPAYDYYPVWSPDGKRLAYCSNRNGGMDLYLTGASGSGEEELLRSPPRKLPVDWSRDGRFLLVEYQDPKATRRTDLWVLAMTGDRRLSPFRQTDFNEREGQFSPDGGWIAYTSDDSGRNEVYVEGFPSGAAPRVRVSAGGGSHPRWRPDGSELFFRSLEGVLMAAPVRRRPTVEIGAPQPLFPIPVQSFGGYDVAPDGKRFLVATVPEEKGPSPITVVFHWTSALRR